ncbi:nad-dependent protein deacetylase sirtuin-7 [Anaeramoeba flamelloides]|uniref:protein acetyllysine N-acetyltransferase n=1 Tax=Anaeramoeba flamelloides TaxID=1746091 RepID=A0AAV7Z278_9EUKA|nr:nad-dependent protein deacetylase sirtuin-7 [Anaeramoeba flamelloides]KAJ6238274.1 nad-dependent protein deacetylase sirtuin-7 [Anaeramoeba flamelloides]
MSSSDELTEYFDGNELLLKKVKKLAKMIRKAKSIVIYTGAGISTAAGVPDYRGPNGVWTCRDQGRKAPRMKKAWNLLEPTYGHMTIATLIERGNVKHLVSQNVDGLHVHSGVPLEKISELHGNTNKEFCVDCEKEYFRPFCVDDESTICTNHVTGRFCDECGGVLHDSIINFGENLNSKILKKATEVSKKCDLALVLGTSLKVTPASSLPVISVKRQTGKLVICNLQKTPKDKYASLLIKGKIDKVCKLLMKELEIPVLTFRQTLELRAKQIKSKEKKKKKKTKNKKKKQVNEKPKVTKKKKKSKKK